MLDWYPVGTGPFMLTENNPNLRMVLSRNPNFCGETYPTKGMPGDVEAGLLADAGRSLPLIEQAIYSLEKENIPRWNKFLQGYLRQLRDFLGRLRPSRARSTPGRRAQSSPQRCWTRASSLLTSVEPSIILPGLQHARPRGGRGHGAGAPPAAGHLDRGGLRGVRLHLHERAGSRRAGTTARRGLLAIRKGRRASIQYRLRWRTAARCAGVSKRPGH